MVDDRGDRQPTYSVVIPNYNHSAYLGSALEAHLGQSRPADEIIVVDDASTDDSCAVVERIAAAAPTVRLIRLERNRGAIAAGRRGLGEARGKYVIFAAADDLVGRDFAERSLAILESHPRAGFCFSDPAELIGDFGVVREFPLFLSVSPRFFSPDEAERLLRRNYFTFPSNTIVYRRDALQAVGGFREDLDWQAEWLTVHTLLFRYGACYVPAVLAYLRVRADSYSAQQVKQAHAQRRQLLRALDLLAGDEFRDVAPRFRRSALATEMRARVLPWLLASPRHRAYLTPRLVFRLLARELWSLARPLAPLRLRRLMRRLSAWPIRRAAREGEAVGAGRGPAAN